MVHIRAHRGPPLVHPISAVPSDPARRGALVRVRGWEIAVADPLDQVRTLSDLVAAAEEIGWDQRPHAGGPPFTDGLVGFLSDDVSSGMVSLPAIDVRPGPAPLAPLWFGRYDHAACRDPSGTWWAVGRTAKAADAAVAMLREATAADRSRQRGRSGAVGDAGAGSGAVADPGTGELWTSIDRMAHRRAVGRIKDWIADGDVYQVNLTLHVGAPWTRSPRRLARNLFGASNEAAHAAYVNAPGATIASISPETFLRLDGRDARIRPIKGTRRRSPDPTHDRALADDLVSAAKDAAEHIMIVDLERNDLGRISEVGSVAVPELMTLEAHPTVWHLTSTVTSRIRADIRFDQILAALFPCGSVTGAPKRMAVDRIRQVEPWRRGVYCGAIGVITRGLTDLSVAIRTAVVHDGQAWYGTGGGIVADSDPDAEWDEAMAKAAAFRTAVQMG